MTNDKKLGELKLNEHEMRLIAFACKITAKEMLDSDDPPTDPEELTLWREDIASLLAIRKQFINVIDTVFSQSGRDDVPTIEN